ncbi:MAG: hypothetical protein AAF802_09685 [Planctomycetota bacterium]
MTLGLRVPPTVEYCERVGMDVRTWASEGLVDFFAVSMFMKQDPNLQVDAFRRSLGETDAQIYATLQRRNYGFGHSASFGQYRAMAANMWGSEKAEGLLLFNWMQQSRRDYDRWMSGEQLNGPHPHLVNELASLETLAGRNKIYSIAWGTDGQYEDLPYFNPLPIDVPRGQTRRIEFGAFEDVANNQPDWITMVVQANPDKRFEVRLNGVLGKRIKPDQRPIPLKRVTGSGRPDKNVGVNDASIKRLAVYFDIPIASLRDGMNEIELRALESGKDDAMSVIRTDVFISYGDESSCGSF